jgi:phytoene dehydrogenase-like protein
VLHKGRIRPFPANPLGFLRTDFLGTGDKLALMRFCLTLGRARPRELARTSVQYWLDLKLCRPRVRRLMGAVARTFTYTSALDLASAELFVERLQRSLKHPIHYVDGGWQVLVDGLHDAAERAGARVVEGARVEAVEVGNGQAQGVRLRGGQLLWASAVVLERLPAPGNPVVQDLDSPRFTSAHSVYTPRVAPEARL